MPFAEPLVRIATGLFLMPHGAQKLFGWFGGRGVDESGTYFVTVFNLPPGMAMFAGLIEFFGGALLALGLLTRIAAGFIAGMMAFIVLAVHWSNGFFWSDNGFEYPLMWCILALSFLARGGGRYSVDAALGVEI